MTANTAQPLTESINSTGSVAATDTLQPCQNVCGNCGNSKPTRSAWWIACEAHSAPERGYVETNYIYLMACKDWQK